jgi:uncharacterized protein GlcG (DUF336 family)
MEQFTLAVAQEILAVALRYGREQKLNPLAVAVLDARGALKAVAAEDGTGSARSDIAIGKASGCIAMGIGGRSLAKRGREVPQFTSALAHLIPRGVVPVAGGVLIRDAQGVVLGAIGISGDASDQDEAAAMAGIAAAGLVADPGGDY